MSIKERRDGDEWRYGSYFVAFINAFHSICHNLLQSNQNKNANSSEM